MTTIAIIFGFLLTVFFLIFRLISQCRVTTISTLEKQQQEVKARYDFMVSQKKELKMELEEKKQKLFTLKNQAGSIKTFSFEDLNCDKMDTTGTISRYLLSQGSITIKQNEHALQKMELMKMDYLGVCLALGFIDLETSKQALKANNSSQ